MFARFKSFTPKQWIALTILAAADVFVIAIPYYLRNIIPNFNQTLGIREDQLANLITIIGIVKLLTQLPGGFLANKYSSRWLLFGACVTTALISFWFGAALMTTGNYTYDNNEGLYIQYAIIWGLWGISSTLIFWAPLWKLVSQQATKENQGIAYGVVNSFNGIIGFIFVWVLLFLFIKLWYPVVKENPASNQGVPFSVFVFILAVFLLAIAVLTLFFVPEKPREKSNKPKTPFTYAKFKSSLFSFWKSIRNWKLWALAFFIMGMYIFQSVVPFYALQMMTNEYHAPQTLVLILTGLIAYVLRIFISWIVGIWADKSRSYTLFLIIATTLALISLAGTILIGYIKSSFVVIGISSLLFVVIGTCVWAMATLRYAQVNEVHIEKGTYASSVGIMSFIGSSSDAWFSPILAGIGKHFTTEGAPNPSLQGYRIIILVALSVAFLGFLSGVIVFLSNTLELKRLGKTDYKWRKLEN
ncbi:MFS transporter [Mycoplasma sp. 6243]|uniref:MFS transporter n=1 Tax=Mycoplasma sp. 6243 TaxID=3440865 RepID=UPI003EB6D4FE